MGARENAIGGRRAAADPTPSGAGDDSTGRLAASATTRDASTGTSPIRRPEPDAPGLLKLISDDQDRSNHSVDPGRRGGALGADADRLPTAPIGHSGTLHVGDLALAIGNPFGVGQTVTPGIISAIGRGELGIASIERFIQTDAAINPGSSGGALVHAQGELVGINTAIFTETGSASPSRPSLPSTLHARSPRTAGSRAAGAGSA